MKKHKKALLAFGVFLVLGIGMAVQESAESPQDHAEVERAAEGSESESRTFFYSAGDKEGEVTVDVGAVQRPEKEARKLLEQAAAEWEAQYLGRNPSAAQVRSDLNLAATFCSGLVTAAYESSDGTLLDPEGHIDTEQIAEEGNTVELRAEFTYGSLTRVESREICLLPPQKGSAEWLNQKIREKVAEAESDSRESAIFTLPDKVDGRSVRWEQQKESRWPYFLLLGFVSAFCLEWQEREQRRKVLRKRNDRLLFEYPQMAEQMALLLCSGMTVSHAWEKMLQTDRQMRKEAGSGERLYIGEMWITHREIREGCGEREAYERFGNRIGLIPYRRFAAILSQNLTKGTRNVRELLTKEADSALELRKNHARKLGEEAGTRLLFPMLLMFVLILLVLLAPAVKSF